jgi:hypothetical protein
MTERVRDAAAAFVVARNPEEDSKLPYLLRLPLEGGLMLKARESWPVTSRVYCLWGARIRFSCREAVFVD